MMRETFHLMLERTQNKFEFVVNLFLKVVFAAIYRKSLKIKAVKIL